ncbi:MAG: hypothetical protein WC709_11265 [Thermoleophilia bacterium]
MKSAGFVASRCMRAAAVTAPGEVWLAGGWGAVIAGGPAPR